MEPIPQRVYDPSQGTVYIPVPVQQSIWTYNFGSTRFIYYLTFQEGPTGRHRRRETMAIKRLSGDSSVILAAATVDHRGGSISGSSPERGPLT